MKKRIVYIWLVVAIFTGCRKNIFPDRSTDPEYNFEAFWHEMGRNYSYFQFSHINWDSIYAVYRPQVNPETTDNNLFDLYSQILDLLHDGHTNICAPMGIGGNTFYFDKYPLNQIDIPDDYFENPLISDRIFEYGKLKAANAGYIKIKTFEGEQSLFMEIDSILSLFQNTTRLIIDVRSNRGGLISNSKLIASRFSDTTRYVCKYRYRNGPNHNDFSDWIHLYNTPSQTGTAYRKPVMILTNRRSYSATEWFVMFAKTIPTVKTVGDTTGGGSSIPLIRELPNGWILRTSNTQLLRPEEGDFQFKGILPDITVVINYEDYMNGVDRILERAMNE